MKYIDNIHVDAIEAEEEEKFIEQDLIEARTVEEKVFILSKFAKFSILRYNDLISLANEAISSMPEEDAEDVLIKKKIKNHDRKSKAFEKETFDVFDYEDETELGNEEYTDIEQTPKDIKRKQART